MNLNKTPIALALATLASTTHLPRLARAAAAAEGPALPAITVTSTRTERRVDGVPNTVTVAPAPAIEQSGALDIKDVFRNELDVTVRAAPSRFTTTGGSGRAGNEGINIRGPKGNQVLMLVDGMRVPNTSGCDRLWLLQQGQLSADLPSNRAAIDAPPVH